MLKRTSQWCQRFCTAGWDVEFNVTFTKRRVARRLLEGCLLAAPLALLSYGAIDRLAAPPHDFSNVECSGCHRAVPRPGQGGPLVFADRIDVLCRA